MYYIRHMAGYVLKRHRGQRIPTARPAAIDVSGALLVSRDLMRVEATWKPYEAGSREPPRDALPNSAFAFPKERKEPLTDAAHVRSAIARFDQVDGVSDHERDVAFANIKKAAQYYGVRLSKTTWRP